MRNSTSNASWFWQRSGFLRTIVGQAVWTAAGGEGVAPVALPAYLNGLADLLEGSVGDVETARSLAERISPGNGPWDDATLAEALDTSSEALGTQTNIDTYRAWATTNAAGGSVTLPAYPGSDPATDNLMIINAWVASSS